MTILSMHMRVMLRRRKGNPVNLPRAFLLALVIEVAAIAVLMNVRVTPKPPLADEPIVMEAVAPELVKPIEPPPPPPKPVVRQVIKAPPRVVRESAPVKLDAPKPTVVPEPATEQVSVPKEVGVPKQAEGAPDAPPTPPKLVVRHGAQRIGGSYPEYPEQARRRKIEGKVLADVTVRPDGTVSDVRIVNAQPPGVFDAEVLKALHAWKFAPDPVGFIGEVEIAFALPNDDDE